MNRRLLLLPLMVLATGALADVRLQRAAHDGEAARASLQDGDRIRAARVSEQIIAIDHPLQLPGLEFMAASGQPITLLVSRDATDLAITLALMDWQLVATPLSKVSAASSTAPLDNHSAGWAWITLERLDEDRDADALAAWVDRIEQSAVSLDPRWRAELLVIAGQQLLALKHPAGRPAIEIAMDYFFRHERRRALSLKLFLQAEEGLGRPLPALRQDLAQVAEIASELPESLLLQAQLAHLDGFYTSVGGDLIEGAALFDQARVLYARIAPHHPLHAQMHNNLGINARRLGDYAAAMAHYRSAEQIADGDNPRERLLRAQFLNNQGVVARNQGDLETAERVFRQSHGLRLDLDLSTRDRIAPLGNLVNVALDRLDLDLALSRQLELIDLLEDSPPSEHQGAAWHGLGSIYLELGDAQSAYRAFEQALSLHKALSPAVHRTASVELGLGRALAQQGRYADGLTLMQKALGDLSAAAPDNIFVARSHVWIGEALFDLEQYGAALLAFDQASARFSNIGPHSAELAQAHFGRARSHDSLGQADAAELAFEASIAAIEAQMLVLGGGRPALARYRERFDLIYKSYARFLIGRGADAMALLQLMERYRANRAVRQLQARALDWQQHLPATLAMELRRFQPRFDAALRRLEHSAGNIKQLQSAQKELQLLRDERDILMARVRSAAPAAAAIRFPDTTQVSTFVSRLPSGTAVVSFLVDGEGLMAVVLVSGQAQLVTVDWPAAQLGQQVQLWLDQLALGRLESGSDLYERLWSPLMPALTNVNRIVLLTDGELGRLPFAALWNSKRYLVSDFAIAYSDSLSAWRHDDPTPGSAGSLILYDPVTNNAEALEPLPFASIEAKTVVDLLPPADAWQGQNASESALDSVGGHLRVLHFATHARVNPVWPMESWLLLSPDAQHNGRLQAWEVFNRLRFDADLVTLSGCATAAGVPPGGEGLMGFTQAFAYAGARNVLATLWAVSDQGSALLMARFYSAIADGLALDQALAKAQRELLAAPVDSGAGWWEALRGRGRFDARPPLHWAAFRLNVSAPPAPIRSNPASAQRIDPGLETRAPLRGLTP